MNMSTTSEYARALLADRLVLDIGHGRVSVGFFKLTNPGSGWAFYSM